MIKGESKQIQVQQISFLPKGLFIRSLALTPLNKMGQLNTRIVIYLMLLVLFSSRHMHPSLIGAMRSLQLHISSIGYPLKFSTKGLLLKFYLHRLLYFLFLLGFSGVCVLFTTTLLPMGNQILKLLSVSLQTILLPKKATGVIVQ